MQHDPDSDTLTWLLSRLNVIQVRGIMRKTLGLTLLNSLDLPYTTRRMSTFYANSYPRKTTLA